MELPQADKRHPQKKSTANIIINGETLHAFGGMTKTSPLDTSIQHCTGEPIQQN